MAEEVSSTVDELNNDRERSASHFDVCLLLDLQRNSSFRTLLKPGRIRLRLLLRVVVVVVVVVEGEVAVVGDVVEAVHSNAPKEASLIFGILTQQVIMSKFLSIPIVLSIFNLLPLPFVEVREGLLSRLSSDSQFRRSSAINSVIAKSSSLCPSAPKSIHPSLRSTSLPCTLPQSHPMRNSGQPGS